MEPGLVSDHCDVSDEALATAQTAYDEAVARTSTSPVTGIPDGADPEEIADMELVANAANTLVSTVPAFGQLMASMLAARQLYAMCLYELDLLMKTADFSATGGLTERQASMFREVLVSAVAAKAHEPFDETVLFTGMTQTVFPWMQRVVVEHTAQQDAERQARFEVNEAKRLATPVSLDLPGCAGLTRQESVLLVGESHVLRWVLQRLTANALQPDSWVGQLVRLVEMAPKTVDPKLVSVPPEGWANCTKTSTGFQKVYESFMDQLTNPPDLLMVDNLLLTQPSVSFVTDAGIANEAQKRLRGWAAAAGAVLVSCVPQSDGLSEFPEQTVEILRQYNRVLEVETWTTDATVVIRINGEEYATVPVEELDTYRISRIVTL